MNVVIITHGMATFGYFGCILLTYYALALFVFPFLNNKILQYYLGNSPMRYTRWYNSWYKVAALVLSASFWTVFHFSLL